MAGEPRAPGSCSWAQCWWDGLGACARLMATSRWRAVSA